MDIGDADYSDIEPVRDHRTPDYMTRATVAELEAWAAEAKRLAVAMRAMPQNDDRAILIKETEEFGRQCDLALAEKRLAEWEARKM